MKTIKTIIIILLAFRFTGYAQERVNERVYIHLDKECYIAGEDIWLKFLVVDKHFQPSTLSSVGYVEISDAEKPYLQWKISLEKGKGSGKIKLPGHIPSGVYQLSGYTKYMRNENQEVFFKKKIGIINMAEGQSGKVELLEKREEKEYITINPQGNIRIITDKNQYSKRNKVNLSIDNLPEEVKDLTVSVIYNDSIASFPIDPAEWTKQVSTASASSIGKKWLPEYEGHIIQGKIIPLTDENKIEEDHTRLTSTLSFVGKDIRVTSGEIDPSAKEITFYTEGVYGNQDMVASIAKNGFPAGYRMEIISPFQEVTAQALPELKLLPDDKSLIYRHIQLQYQQLHAIDSLGNATPVKNLYDLPLFLAYDLDEYTRFNTQEQTLIEFVMGVTTRKADGRDRIKVFKADRHQVNLGNTLVLLDGIPLYDHELILKYNPHLLKKIDVYDGKYVFGKEDFDCIVAFHSIRGNLPSIRLSEESQLFPYHCPELPVTFKAPGYENETPANSLFPDFRHTLFWEPVVEEMIENKKVDLSFYTSDWTGEYKIVVEGFAKDGSPIYGCSFLQIIP